MASNNAYGPQVVTDGLVLCLDANNAKSYPGAGTTWYDLSGKGNHATINNAVFDTSEKGFLLDGTNDWMTRTTFDNVSMPMNGVSVFVGCKSADFTRGSFAERFYLFDSRYSGSTATGVGVGFDASSTGYATIMSFVNDVAGYDEAAGPDGFAEDTFYIVGLSRISGATSFKALTTDSKTLVTPTLTASSTGLGTGGFSPGGYVIGTGYSISNSYTFMGHIYFVWVYNRALSQKECVQNYNALRSRFGL